MKELAHLIIKTFPTTKSKICASGKIDPQEHQRSRFDISRAKKNLDWMPSISLEKGVVMWANYLREKQQ